MNASPQSFGLSSAIYLLRPTGDRAANLEELRAGIERASPAVLFYHAQMPRMLEAGGNDLPIDGFSSWVGGVVQDHETAERMAFTVHSTPPEVESLRRSLLELLGGIPEATRIRRDAPEGGAFVFFTFDSVPIPLERVATEPDAVLEALAEADTTTWFHHLVEEAWLPSRSPALIEWLHEAGATRLATLCEREAGSGLPIAEVRRRILRQWRRWRLGTRVIEAGEESEEARRAAGRDAVAGLARRLVRRNEGS